MSHGLPAIIGELNEVATCYAGTVADGLDILAAFDAKCAADRLTLLTEIGAANARAGASLEAVARSVLAWAEAATRDGGHANGTATRAGDVE